MLIIKSRRKRALGLERAAQARVAQAAGDAPRLPRAGLHDRRGDRGGAGDARRADESAPRARGAVAGHCRSWRRTTICNIRGRGQDPVHLLRPRGRREHRRLERAGRQGRRPARLPVARRATRSRACPATCCRTTPRRTSSTPSSAWRSTRTARSCAACSRRLRPTTRAGVNGAVIAARSENDTGNNPHNPMYGIAKAGVARRAADADRLAELRLRRQLDGAGDADGSGQSPDQDRSRVSDVTGLVDTGELGTLFTDRRQPTRLDGRGHGADGAHQRAEAAARSIRRLPTARDAGDPGASAAT